MAENPLRTDPHAAEPGPDAEDGDVALRASAKWLLMVFLVVLGINLANLIWLGLRHHSSTAIRPTLDAVAIIISGGSVLFYALRVLTLFPFRMTDLFTVVIVLSLWQKLMLDLLGDFQRLGIVSSSAWDDSSVTGNLIALGLISASVLVAGAAWALRSCHRLKVENLASRALIVACGMLAFPAAASLAAAPPVALLELASEKGSSKAALIYVTIWFASVFITTVNTFTFVRSSALSAAIDTNQPLAK